jgi:MoxR-like ATPase
LIFSLIRHAERKIVFLRALEYYSGILFLTTNREGLIDESFKSRIHIALHYNPIDTKRKEEIWRNMLRKIERDNDENKINIQFHREELLRWAVENSQTVGSGIASWNGRQIRNAFQIAIALASWERLEDLKRKNLSEEDAIDLPEFQTVDLRASHFSTVARVVHDFESYSECYITQ